MTTTQSDDLRRQAAEHRQNSIDSFERCDTDGFMSQWASDCMARLRDFEADIADNDGRWEFPMLLTLEGEFVPARPISAKYGMCWMILDADGQATGEFAPYKPKRASTLANRGFQEGRCLRPARAKLGQGVTPLPYAYPTEPWHQPPTETIN